MSQKAERCETAVVVTQLRYLRNNGDPHDNLLSWASSLIDQTVRVWPFGRIPPLGAGIVWSELKMAGFKKVSMVNLEDQGRLEKLAGDASLVAIGIMDIAVDLLPSILKSIDPNKIALGGLGATHSEEAIREKFPDITIVRGEAEGVIGQLVNDLMHGQMKPVYERTYEVEFTNPADIQYLDPKYSFRQLPVFKTSSYQSIETSRGCSEKCNFCHTGKRKSLTVKPIEVVKAELELIEKGKGKFAFIIDQNLLAAEHSYLHELFEMINRMNIRWIGEGTIMNVINDENLIRAMAKNCLFFLVGVEDMFNSVPGAPRKNALNGNFSEIVDFLRAQKLPVAFSLIVGLDNQDKDSFARTTSRIKDLKLNTVIHVATPRPGTPWYDSLSSQGRLNGNPSIERDMRNHIVFQPKNMNGEDVMREYARLLKEVFSPPEIAARFWNNTKIGGLKYAYGLLPAEIINYVSYLKLSSKYPERT